MFEVSIVQLILSLFCFSSNTPIKAVEQLCTRMWHPDAVKSYICFSFHVFFSGKVHTPPVISSLLSGQISLSDIDVFWVTLLFPITPLLGLMTWKWIDELPAPISPLKPCTSLALLWLAAWRPAGAQWNGACHTNFEYNYLCMTLTCDKVVFSYTGSY